MFNIFPFRIINGYSGRQNSLEIEGQVYLDYRHHFSLPLLVISITSDKKAAY